MSLLLVWCIAIRPSTQCSSRYTTQPIDGFSCQTSGYKNISDVQFHQCTHACIGNSTCWSLSYNHIGRYCLLSDAQCVTAKVSDGFSLVIVRANERQSCMEWIPFNNTYGLQHGLPKRAVQSALARDLISVVARTLDTTGTLVGRSISDDYQANLVDSSNANVNHDDGFEILVVGNSCSTAWVPYTVGDPIPATAVTAGKDNLDRNLYVVGRDLLYFHFGGYIDGASDAYYSNNDGTSSTSFRDILLLISVK